MNVEGKNIIISGGSLGIGKETARGLVNKGANVLITGRSEDRLIEAKNILVLKSLNLIFLIIRTFLRMLKTVLIY